MSDPSASGGIVTLTEPWPVGQSVDVDDVFAESIPDHDVHPDVIAFGMDFVIAHIEHVKSVRCVHLSALSVSMVCDHCNRVGARSCDSRKRKGVK